MHLSLAFRFVLALLLALAGFGPVVAAPPAPSLMQTQRAADRVERHIQDLHQRLSITPDQQPQWDAFANVLRRNADDVENAHVGTGPTSDNALEAMRTYTARARIHADNLARLLPVFQALYTALSPDQQAAADKTFREFQERPTPRP